MVVLCALLAAVCMVTSCDTAADDDGGANVVGVWSYSETDDDGGTEKMTITCYNDNTWKLTLTGTEESQLVSFVWYKGTYSGDWSKDGEIVITITHELNYETLELEELPKPLVDDVTLSSNTETLNFAGDVYTKE